MSHETVENDLADLVAVPAADVKRRGWRGIMRVVSSKAAVVVTNHAEPEAVIVTVAEYSRLRELARQSESKVESALGELRRRFDQRLAVLDAQQTGNRLRSVMKKRVALDGKVKAGRSH